MSLMALVFGVSGIKKDHLTICLFDYWGPAEGGRIFFCKAKPNL